MEARSAAYVGLGGICGAATRWAIGELVPGGSGWPWPVLVANIVGCAVLGALLARYATSTAPAVVAVTTGYCGALTTFSSFAVEIAVYLRDGRAAMAVSYLSVSCIAGVLAYLVGARVAAPAVETPIGAP